MNSLGIKKGDTVVVISGHEKDKKGKVLSTSFKDGTVLVEGGNIVKRHTKARKQGDPSGIIEKPAALRACKVMRVCPKCSKPTRTAWTTVEGGEKVRVCKKCNAQI